MVFIFFLPFKHAGVKWSLVLCDAGVWQCSGSYLLGLGSVRGESCSPFDLDAKKITPPNVS